VISVLNYGVGNLKSIVKAIEYVGGKARVTDSIKDIKNSDALIFPGVGAFKPAIQKINAMRETIESLTIPILGICLGMQLFATKSTEGGLHHGLNYIPGEVIRFPGSVGKIPHIGWNEIRIVAENELLDGVEDGSHVYFVHSYYMRTDKRYALTETDYGIRFISGVAKDNYYGFQFHPEKSGKVGLKILENFVRMSKR
jgi:glutamine amidotransferase